MICQLQESYWQITLAGRNFQYW